MPDGLYTRLFEFTQDGIYRYTLDKGRILFANQGLVDILDLGCVPDDIKGKFLGEVLVYTEKEKTIRRSLEEKGEIHGFEYHFKTLKGEDRWVIHDSFLATDPVTGEKIVEAIVKDITEHKRYEQVLVENSERYRRLFEDSATAQWEHDWSEVRRSIDALKKGGIRDLKGYFDDYPEVVRQYAYQTRIINVNKQALALCEADNKDELMRNLKRVFAPETFDAFRELIIAFIEGKSSFEAETIIQTLKGSTRYVALRISMTAEYEETWSKVSVSALDITERKRTEMALAISEANYRAIFDTANDAIIIHDIKTFKIVDVNHKGCEMFCYSHSEMVRLTMRNIVAGRGQHTVKRMAQSLKRAAEGQPQLFEWMVRDRAGRFFWVEMNLKRAIIGSRYCLVAIVRDITERKEIEEQLKESELRFRKAVLEAPFPMMIHSQDGEVLLINKAWTRFSGYVQKDMPTVFEWIKRCRAGVRESVLRADIERLCKSGGHIEKGEYVITAKNGEKRIWDFKASSLGELPSGRRLVMGVAIDITEHRQAELAIEHLASFPHLDPNPVMELNESGDFTFCNKAVYRALKWKGLRGDRRIFLPHDIEVIAKALRSGREKQVYSEVKIGKTTFAEYIVFISQFQTVRIYAIDITRIKEMEARAIALNKELVESNALLSQLAIKDSHTGLYNHRYLEDAVESEFARSKRHASPFSVIMFDIDYFKSINDVYGHQFGDLVLKQFSDHLRKTIRRYDIPIRYGGEEFIVITPGVHRQDALGLAKRIVEAVTLLTFGNKKHSVKIKLSGAVASYPEDGHMRKGTSLVNIVDKVLNKVKEDGGSRVYSMLDIKKKRVAETRRRLDNVKTLREKLEKLTRRGNQSLIEAISAFAKTIELKDHYTGEHVEKTVRYATAMARQLGLSPADIDFIRQGAMLHDLGKIGVSDKILGKREKLTEKEFTEIMKHPQIGADIVRPIQFMRDIIPLILYHHEKWNGEGYPYNLKGEEIPIGARIIAIADVYQALTSDRPYRKAYSKSEAVKIIKRGAGTQFDPKIVRIFLRILRRES